MPRGRPRKTPEEKTQERTLSEIEDVIEEGEETKQVLEEFTDKTEITPKKTYKIELMMFIGCLLILAFGTLEKGPVIEFVGATGLIIVLIFTLYKYAK